MNSNWLLAFYFEDSLQQFYKMAPEVKVADI